MLVNACLSTGAYCEIDIHNYARNDGEVGFVAVIWVRDLNHGRPQIIDQGGPSILPLQVTRRESKTQGP
ncbi:hypothetical protein J3R82DRAFT_6565 [Butyriboletus roseoflavus]|nr:hypothetical protein J3R82DRAFT_6565 [Butyriboletus roseoflavus]